MSLISQFSIPVPILNTFSVDKRYVLYILRSFAPRRFLDKKKEKGKPFSTFPTCSLVRSDNYIKCELMKDNGDGALDP